MGLVLSDRLVEEARTVAEAVRSRLTAAAVAGELVLTGALSVPGALTKGDIDLHLRVDDRFAEVAERVARLYSPAERQAWAPTLAVFAVPAARDTGLAVTPRGSVHDVRFTRAWERLRADASLLEEYNALKRGWFGTPEYAERKAAFFGRITGT